MDHETVTPHPGADTAWHRTTAGEWLLVGMIGGEDYRSSQIVAADPVQKLARTTTGKVRHVPGQWPIHLDLPAMRAPVREWVEPEFEIIEALSEYLAENVGGEWGSIARCRDLIPGARLDAYPSVLLVEVPADRPLVTIRHPATNPRAIAEALRDLPALRAWLLSELDAARAVVGGAA
jgi:hypothetical protein